MNKNLIKMGINTNNSYDYCLDNQLLFLGITQFDILNPQTSSTSSFPNSEKEVKEIIIDNSNNSKNEKFIIKKISKKKHGSSSSDNLFTKIQVHFLSFIVDIANDALLTVFKDKNYNFKKIPYKEKIKVKHIIFEYLKNSTIENVLKNNISPKFKNNLSFDYNESLLNEVCNLSDWLNEFFDMNYLKLFNYYYNKQKPLKKIVFKEKEIKLSKNTKSFYYLLEKNSKDKNELIKIVKSNYYDGNDILLFC
jgi:hypothetical protein